MGGKLAPAEAYLPVGTLHRDCLSAACKVILHFVDVQYSRTDRAGRVRLILS